jgi:hypothetical protein
MIRRMRGNDGRPRVEYRCSFCGKAQQQVHRLIAGPGGVYICNECVDLCEEIISQEEKDRSGRQQEAECVVCNHPVPGSSGWSVSLPQRFSEDDDEWQVSYPLHEDCIREIIPSSVLDQMLETNERLHRAVRSRENNGGSDGPGKVN